MPVALRESEILWEGPLGGGAGELTSGSGALNKLGVTWASRTKRPEGRTSPEELIAAAHASCFAMALALVLGGNQTPPERLAVKATCTLDEVDGAPRITTIELAVRAQVPGLQAADLERLIESAGDLCPVSNALRGNVKINVRSELLPGHSSRPSHSRQEAEVEDIVRTLSGYRVLTRARLLELCGAAHWSDGGGRRAVADAVSSGRIRQLGGDLYEIAEPPDR
jgi:osmotically inducible protein OsmC